MVAAFDDADRHERAKDYLSPGEVVKLLDAVKAGRHSVRDHLLMLMTYRHGLWVSEAVGLRRDELDLDHVRLWVRRRKGGLSVEPPITGDELRAIRCHVASRTDALPWLFISERGQPLTWPGGQLPDRRSCQEIDSARHLLTFSFSTDAQCPGTKLS